MDRQKPKQARAAVTRQRILTATERLLAEYPPVSISTKMIAQEAEIPIGSLYRYFADVDAVFHTLFAQYNAETLRAIQESEWLDDDWRQAVTAIMTVVEETHQRYTAYGALTLHLSFSQETDKAILEAIIARLGLGHGALEPETARTVAQTIVAIIDGIERWSFRLNGADKGAAFEQGRRAVIAYLGSYFET